MESTQRQEEQQGQEPKEKMPMRRVLMSKGSDRRFSGGCVPLGIHGSRSSQNELTIKMQRTEQNYGKYSHV